MSNYTKNQYVDDKNNSWNIVFSLVKEGETVLDVGCSSGNFGAELIKRKQCTVDGIDIDPKDVALARKKLRHTYVMNIETDELTKLSEKYDAILMMDVIEHLVDPVAALNKIAKLLKPTGRLVFSVPNMAHVSVRLDLLLGKFAYSQTGVLDYTHLHFYTEEALLNTLQAAGFSVVQAKSATVTYPDKLLQAKLRAAGLKLSPDFIKKLHDTQGNIYQFIGTAKPGSPAAKPLSFPDASPHEVHFQEVYAALEDRHRETVARMQEQLQLKDQHIANIQAELDTIHQSRSYRLAHATARAVHRTARTLKGRDT